jgi:biopolymer transport protein ExbB/TolQ
MSDLKWWHALGGAASMVVSPHLDKKEEQFNAIGGGIAMAVVFVIIGLVIAILLVVLAYKMFPENKFMHALLTFILGLFWLIPAMLYYLFVLDGYHMQGIHIVKRKGRKH